MNTRKGLGKGLGCGYKNLAPMDAHIHSLSAKGLKTTTVIPMNATGDAKGKKLKSQKKGQILQPLGLFATYTPEQLNNYIESMSGEDKRIAYLSYGLTWNMLSKELKSYKVDMQPMGIFATKSRNDLAKYLESFSNPDEKRLMYLIWGLTWNMVAKKVNK